MIFLTQISFFLLYLLVRFIKFKKNKLDEFGWPWDLIHMEKKQINTFPFIY